jgi:hypothetical protein
MRAKTNRQLEEQYKKLLQRAFPLLRFKGITWNWYQVYESDPWQNTRFLLINRAFTSTAEKRHHPFYYHGK